LFVLACIKQVPDTTEVKMDPETGTLIREGVPSVINPSDVNAVEECLKLKEVYGAKVAVMTMGPPQAEDALRDLLAMGADRAILLTDRAMVGADTLATSYTISTAVRRLEKDEGPADLIFFGRQALDGQTGQVGPGVAARLGIPIITYTTRIVKVDPDERSLVAERKADDMTETVKVPMPAAISVVEKVNKPRRAPIEGILRAQKADVERWDKDTIGADPTKLGLLGSPTIVRKMFVPKPRGRGEIFDGRNDPAGAARWLKEKILSSRAFTGKPVVTLASSTGDVQPVVKRETGSDSGPVWVYVEQNEGRAADVSWELLGAGATLAKKLGTNVEAIVIGCQVEEIVEEAASCGASKVYLIDHPVLRHYRTAPYAKGLSELAISHRPQVLLIGATRNGRDLSGTVATNIRTGLTADCTSLDIEPDTGLLLQIRPTWGEKQLAIIMTPKHRPQMSTVRPGVFPKPPKIDRTVETVKVNMNFTEEETPAKIIDYEWIERSSLLQESDIVVSGGRGLGSEKDFQLVRGLAKALGGAVGASRRAVESGFADKESQVGQTGKTIRPKLYVGVGVSGSIQHMVGIEGAETVIAVNIDPDAPIFNSCNYGVIGDATEILPLLTEQVRRQRKRSTSVDGEV
jgi:electron transfer flavoprotein alpha subunit